MFVLLLLACTDDGRVAPAPVKVPARTAAPREETAPDPVPGDAAPGGAAPARKRQLTLSAVVLELAGRSLHASTAEGILDIPLAADAFSGDPPAQGTFVRVDVTLGPCGEYLARRVEAQPGLPVVYGRVSEVAPDHVTLDAPGGPLRLGVQALTDVTPDLRPGLWVGARTFHQGDEVVALSVHEHPGTVVDVGVITSVEASRFRVTGLGGERCWRGQPTGYAVGESVRVEGDWSPNRGFEARRMAAQDTPAPFLGRFVVRDMTDFSLVDAGDGIYGRVRFELPQCDDACQALQPQDGVAVTWHVDPKTLERVVDTLTPRALQDLVVGEVERLDDKGLVVRGGDGRPVELRIAPETSFAQPAHVGDVVTVLAKGDGAARVAVLVAEE